VSSQHGGPSNPKDEGLLPNGKYTVFKNTETGAIAERVEEPVFVLKFADPLARPAIKRYAQAAHTAGYEKLAEDLIQVLERTEP
jgi:hypothetical protein